ncbi:MAG: hypothetical protein COX19_00045 [Desulfobacterales bacterium CG23_combo_of_CG06-09_8_20_14_all_51_8]|nr:MAG: hypothetical protein COX19_00045 [Desulfobacterales bacterium CG23_combo_of_CG06-09_8_20_14_all_51_8]
MGEYYKDIAELYKIYGYFMEKILTDPKVGPKLASSRLIIKWIYTDPDGEITIDLRNPPNKEGQFGSYYLGPCHLKEDVWSKQSADHSHRFWHGLENPVASVTRGKIRQGGKITAMLKLLPLVRPMFQFFPMALKDLGYDHLLVKKEIKK